MARGGKRSLTWTYSPFSVVLGCLCFTTVSAIGKGAHMRRKWPALAAAIPLVLGWAVTAAGPAAAAPPGGGSSAVQPGGPVSALSTPGMPSGTVTPQISGQQPRAIPGGGSQNAVVTSSNW